MLRGGVELSQWSQRPGQGTAPSVETVYSPVSLPGLGTRTTYLHSEGTVGFDRRTAPGYARRGGFYGVTLHDYTDRENQFGFQQLNYEAIQHIPILREAWTISARPRADGIPQGRSANPILHAAVGWRRFHPARIHQLALPRPEQSVGSSGVADHGESLH